jgi:hypothetical protein
VKSGNYVQVVNRMASDLGSQKYSRTSRHCILSITSRCNLRCLYCRGSIGRSYDTLSQEAENLDLPMSKWHTLVETFAKFHVQDVLLPGGEPLEYPFLKDLLLLLKSIGMDFALHTNGFSKRWSETLGFLSSSALRPRLVLSTELFADMQEEIRECRSLPVDFVETARRYGFDIQLKIVLHQGLVCYDDRIAEVLRFWIGKGVDSIRFQPVFATSDSFPKSLILSQEAIPMLRMLRDLKLSGGVFGDAILNSPSNLDLLIGLLYNEKPQSERINGCSVKETYVFITPDVKILNCLSLWGHDRMLPCENLFDATCCCFCD